MKAFDNEQPAGDARMQEFASYRSYMRSRYLSIKHSSYFQVYDELLERYRNRPITFVEIGVLNGGSLFMWRDYFGPEARIIGVDFNPIAKQWEKDGFEIRTGNQADPRFWQSFFAEFGDVDVVLDDGGHTNEQQIVTSQATLPRIRDGGMLIVEDTHTSYSREFGYPSAYTFINYSKMLVDGINARFPAVRAPAHALNKMVWSIAFYESIVCFQVDRRKCFVNSSTTNGGITANAEDFRHHNDTAVGRVADLKVSVEKKLGLLERVPLIRSATSKLFKLIGIVLVRWRLKKLAVYFRTS